MRLAKLEYAIEEAYRFLEFAMRARQRLEDDPITQIGASKEALRFVDFAVAARRRLEDDPITQIGASKEMAACKRSSMDLTRALAELRKP